MSLVHFNCGKSHDGDTSAERECVRRCKEVAKSIVDKYGENVWFAMPGSMMRFIKTAYWREFGWPNA